MQPLVNAQQLQLETGKAPGDEDVLVAALHAGVSMGHTPLHTLNKMQGVNGHSTEDWKGYYMVNAQRIDGAVAALRIACHETIVKKDIDDDEIEILPAASSTTRRTRSLLPRLDHARNESSQVLPKEESVAYRSTVVPKYPTSPPARRRDDHVAPGSPRRSHQGAPPPFFRLTLKPLSTFPTPTRPPVPPTKVVKTSLGNVYTPEDKAFFIKFILWEASRDPNITKTAVLSKLRKLVPYHSTQSWISFWARNGGNEVLAEALHRCRAALAVQQVSHATDAVDSNVESSTNLPPALLYEDMPMGRRLEGFTLGDLHAMARAATTMEWQSTVSDQGKGAVLHEMYPQRSVSGWANGFRRNAAHIMELTSLYDGNGVTRRRQAKVTES
ncbi:hypothetical protein OF83DRAFT_1169850 [Amylostereum chailletii]|nr:hypothetical protein OF83DRAFT_1169850 [Amylostereum chailletii]